MKPKRRKPRGSAAKNTPRPRRAHLGRFQAIGEAGARNAATALSQIIGRPVRLDVPWADAVPLEQVATAAGGASRVVCALSLRVYGEVRGNLLLVFEQDQVRRLLDLVLHHSGVADGSGRATDHPELSAMERSALLEVGNILACAYLNAVGHLLGVSLLPSIPGLALDMMGAVTDFLLIEMAPLSDTAVVFACEVREPASGLRGEIFFLPDPRTLAAFEAAQVELT
jgi:chemotaxis protein CheC